MPLQRALPHRRQLVHPPTDLAGGALLEFSGAASGSGDDVFSSAVAGARDSWSMMSPVRSIREQRESLIDDRLLHINHSYEIVFPYAEGVAAEVAAAEGGAAGGGSGSDDCLAVGPATSLLVAQLVAHPASAASHLREPWPPPEALVYPQRLAGSGGVFDAVDGRAGEPAASRRSIRHKEYILSLLAHASPAELAAVQDNFPSESTLLRRRAAAVAAEAAAAAAGAGAAGARGARAASAVPPSWGLRGLVACPCCAFRAATQLLMVSHISESHRDDPQLAAAGVHVMWGDGCAGFSDARAACEAGACSVGSWYYHESGSEDTGLVRLYCSRSCRTERERDTRTRYLANLIAKDDQYFPLATSHDFSAAGYRADGAGDKRAVLRLHDDCKAVIYIWRKLDRTWSYVMVEAHGAHSRLPFLPHLPPPQGTCTLSSLTLHLFVSPERAPSRLTVRAPFTVLLVFPLFASIPLFAAVEIAVASAFSEAQGFSIASNDLTAALAALRLTAGGFPGPSPGQVERARAPHVAAARSLRLGESAPPPDQPCSLALLTILEQIPSFRSATLWMLLPKPVETIYECLCGKPVTLPAYSYLCVFVQEMIADLVALHGSSVLSIDHAFDFILKLVNAAFFTLAAGTGRVAGAPRDGKMHPLLCFVGSSKCDDMMVVAFDLLLRHLLARSVILRTAKGLQPLTVFFPAALSDAFISLFKVTNLVFGTTSIYRCVAHIHRAGSQWLARYSPGFAHDLMHDIMAILKLSDVDELLRCLLAFLHKQRDGPHWVGLRRMFRTAQWSNLAAIAFAPRSWDGALCTAFTNAINE
jgi:hypothetical protein